MATTTTNFGWDIPQSTDLVKDGATAIAALGQDIDTALVDLKGGTTGQVLSKNSNTDLDFTWVAQDDTNAIQNTIIDAKGDLIVGASADTPTKLTVGTDGYFLKANSGATNGVEWSAVSADSMTQLATGSLATSAGAVTSLTSINSGYKTLILRIYNYETTGAWISIRVNNDSGSYYMGINQYALNQADSGSVSAAARYNNTIRLYGAGYANTTDGSIEFSFPDYAVSKRHHQIYGFASCQTTTSSQFSAGYVSGGYRTSSAHTISEINIYAESPGGVYTHAGTYVLYGVK